MGAELLVVSAMVCSCGAQPSVWRRTVILVAFYRHSLKFISPTWAQHQRRLPTRSLGSSSPLVVSVHAREFLHLSDALLLFRRSLLAVPVPDRRISALRVPSTAHEACPQPLRRRRIPRTSVSNSPGHPQPANHQQLSIATSRRPRRYTGRRIQVSGTRNRPYIPKPAG